MKKSIVKIDKNLFLESVKNVKSKQKQVKKSFKKKNSTDFLRN